jgi:hypothetical protein
MLGAGLQQGISGSGSGGNALRVMKALRSLLTKQDMTSGIFLAGSPPFLANLMIARKLVSNFKDDIMETYSHSNTGSRYCCWVLKCSCCCCCHLPSPSPSPSPSPCSSPCSSPAFSLPRSTASSLSHTSRPTGHEGDSQAIS